MTSRERQFLQQPEGYTDPEVQSRRREQIARLMESMDSFGDFKEIEQAAIVHSALMLYEFEGAENTIEREKLVNGVLQWMAEKKFLHSFFRDDVQWKRRDDRVFELLTHVVPQNFLTDNIKELHALRRELMPPVEVERDPHVHSLFHGTSDQSTLRILTRGFQKLDEHGKSNVGTGALEQHLGLDGAFMSYGDRYHLIDDKAADDDNSDTDDANQFVFSAADVIEQPGTVSIRHEASFAYLSDLEHFGYALADIQDASIHEMNHQMRDRTRATAMLARLLCDFVVLPDEMQPYADTYDDPFEVCAKPESLGTPQMLIVSEEPEYFYDEAVEHRPDFAAQVPIVTHDRIHKALMAFPPENDPPALKGAKMSFYGRFVYYVNAGKIDLEEVRYRTE